VRVWALERELAPVPVLEAATAKDLAVELEQGRALVLVVAQVPVMSAQRKMHYPRSN
jgi:hypothetical protein